MALLRAAKTNSEDALNRLCELVEQGRVSPSDRDFAERLTTIGSASPRSPPTLHR